VLLRSLNDGLTVRPFPNDQSEVKTVNIIALQKYLNKQKYLNNLGVMSRFTCRYSLQDSLHITNYGRMIAMIKKNTSKLAFRLSCVLAYFDLIAKEFKTF
jgi:hypothetical protein